MEWHWIHLGVWTLLEKQTFVPVHNPYLYRVLNRYKASDTNVVEHLYRVRYLAHLYWVESQPSIYVGGAVSLCLSHLRHFRSFFPLFSFLSLIFFSHSQSRSRTTHSQSQNIQPLIQIIYLTIK
jgi:hypothetical protein